jgi:hypothetical protein
MPNVPISSHDLPGAIFWEDWQRADVIKYLILLKIVARRKDNTPRHRNMEPSA